MIHRLKVPPTAPLRLLERLATVLEEYPGQDVLKLELGERQISLGPRFDGSEAALGRIEEMIRAG